MGMKSFSHIKPLKQWNPQKTKQTKANQEILATALQTVYIEDKKRFSEYDEAKHNEKKHYEQTALLWHNPSSTNYFPPLRKTRLLRVFCWYLRKFAVGHRLIWSFSWKIANNILLITNSGACLPRLRLGHNQLSGELCMSTTTDKWSKN